MSEQLTVITGASSGIGAAMAASAGEAAHTVATVSRRPGPGQHLAADLADPAAWSATADWIDGLVAGTSWDRVTLIHNAGTLDPIGFAGEVDHASYQANVLLNSASAQVLGDRFIAAVRRANCAAMLMMISSGAGKNPYLGWSSYCAGKAAVDMWCRTVGIEQDALADADQDAAAVSVVSMAPGVVATDMQAMIRDQDETAFPNVERFREMHAGGALGDPAEVGAAIFDLSQQTCDGSTYRGATLTNGAVLDIRDLA